MWRRSGRSAQKDVLARKPFPSPGGLFDRTDQQWIVIDVDGTRQAARGRALPQTDRLPTPHRRFDQVCAPGYQGRKRGEVVRTSTVVREKHTHQFLGTFGAQGNGDYRGDLRRATQVITSYAATLGVPSGSFLVRLDGMTGDAAPFFCFGALARLATLQHPANLAERGPQPNGLPGQLHSALSTTRSLLRREDPHPSGARALTSFLGPAPGAKCSSSRCSPAHRHASWTPSHLCYCLWF